MDGSSGTLLLLRTYYKEYSTLTCTNLYVQVVILKFLDINDWSHGLLECPHTPILARSYFYDALHDSCYYSNQI
jgi:hypothetical protein